MKKNITIWLAAVMALLAVPAAVNAATTTVFDGTQLSVYVPLPTASYNEGGTRGQVIYPAWALEEMAGQPINGFTLYINNEGCKMNGGELRISLGEVSSSVFSSETYFSGLTRVALVEMHAGLTEVDIDFDAPYTYNGGNLVIDFYVQTPGESAEYNFTYFYGQFQEGHTSVSGGEFREFIPKTTFYYGEREAYAARVNPRSLAFEAVRTGERAQATVTLTNTGLNAFTPTVSAGAPFSATVPQAPVQPGETVEITAAFEPVVAGNHNGVLLVDCGNDVVVEVPVSGVALEGGQPYTVCSGDDLCTKLPFNGIYFSDEGTYGQMIYPASLLTSVLNTSIVALTFHVDKPLVLKDGTLQLSLMTTDQQEFATATPIAGMTAVATTVPVRGEQVITFELDTPFDYKGGNLAVEVRVTDSKGNYGTTSFYGIATDYNAGLSTTHSQWTGDKSELVQFLPMITFTAQPAAGYILGDADQSGTVGIGDVTVIIDYILSHDAAGINLAAADCNQDGNLSIGDVTMLVDYILTGVW